MSRRTRAWMAGAGAFGLAIVVLGGVWLKSRGGGALSLDLWWQPIPVVSVGGPLEGFALALNFLGSVPGVLLIAGLFAVVFLLAQRLRDAAVLVTALLIGFGCLELLKPWIARPRPAAAMLQLSDYSYPSGHSMGAAAIATALSLGLCALHRANMREKLETSRAAWLLPASAGALWMVAMMWSRTALEVHWLSDTVAGALLGISAALIAQAIWGSSGPRRGSFASGIAVSR